MRILTLLAQKGGTGKTTLSIHLALTSKPSGDQLKSSSRRGEKVPSS